MRRVKNADEFLLEFRRLLSKYRQIFAPKIAKIRARYSGSPVDDHIEQTLEVHIRAYVVNCLLAALNWRQDASPENGLPSLFPEAPVRSKERGTIRFLDYLGLEKEAERALLIVETKRPGALLPQLKAREAAATYSEVISRGLAGTELSGDWNQWLRDLRDYVQSVYRQTKSLPGRVVITNGNWLILFLDPADVFLNSDASGPADILVFENRDDIERRHAELFRYLEYYHVLGESPPLTPANVPFLLDGSKIDRAMHGLRLLYFEQPGIFQHEPVIKVAPVVFLRSCFSAWFRVESPPKDYPIPHKSDELAQHIEEVDRASRSLLDEVNRRLRTSLEPFSIEKHYEDEDSFRSLPCVRECRPDDFLVVTGDKTHYLLPEPSVLDCPYHEWSNCNEDGVPSNPGPITIRSLNPRSFFISGEPHHCAHRDVYEAKGSEITPKNINRCGLRSGREGQAFCEIWLFEQHLCCRACVFQEVCTRSPVFQLPCAPSFPKIGGTLIEAGRRGSYARR